jgi:predicted nucleotidyltransferase component of viral defense system
MKTITTREHDLIVSVRNDALTDLPLGVLEKDLLLTQVLHAVDEVDRDGIRLIFCGGTCLAKAHGLIERMSEDIDFKLVVPEGLSRNARSKQLSQYKKRLASALESLGFLVPPNEIIARDENSYVSLNLHYQSRFPLVASLRSEIKLELNARPPILPTLPLPINSILNECFDRRARVGSTDRVYRP